MAFNPLYKETTMPSPLVPVTLEDYDGSFPVKRVSSKALVAGNPLIPVMAPAERVANSELYSSRDSPVSSDFYGGQDYEHDYFYRRYTVSVDILLFIEYSKIEALSINTWKS